MSPVVQHLILLLPVPLEVIFDKIAWAMGKDDKPVSTWVFRPLVFFSCWLLVYTNSDVQWWRIIIVELAYFFLFFNYAINMVLKRPFFYLGNNWFDKQLARIHNWPRLWLQIWLAILAVCIYHYYELINTVKTLF